MRFTREIPAFWGWLTVSLTALLSVLALTATATATATAAAGATPKTGTYAARSTQCGSAALAHPCYTFTIKITKGRCFAIGDSAKRAGYCASFSHKDNSAMVFADVTCPDTTTFQSQIQGPEIPLRLSSAGSLRFSSHSGVTEAGKELVVAVEKITLTVKGSHVGGTLVRESQEHIGNEPPICTSGTVAFTAKRL